MSQHLPFNRPLDSLPCFILSSSSILASLLSPLPQCLICHLTSFMLSLLLTLILAVTSLFLSFHLLLDTGHSRPPRFGFPEPPRCFVSVGYALEQRSSLKGLFSSCVRVCSWIESCYFWMCALIIAQECELYACICVWFLYLQRRGHTCSFLQLIALDIHTRGQAHSWLRLWVQVGFPWVWAHAHAYIRVRVCSCFLRINNAIQPYYETTEQTDTDAHSPTKHVKLHLWFISHTPNNASMSKLYGPRWLRWPQSIHVWNTGGRREGAEPCQEANTWTVTAATTTVILDSHRLAEIMNYVEKPIGEQRRLLQVTGGLQVWNFAPSHNTVNWWFASLGNCSYSSLEWNSEL